MLSDEGTGRGRQGRGLDEKREKSLLKSNSVLSKKKSFCFSKEQS